MVGKTQIENKQGKMQVVCLNQNLGRLLQELREARPTPSAAAPEVPSLINLLAIGT